MSRVFYTGFGYEGLLIRSAADTLDFAPQEGGGFVYVGTDHLLEKVCAAH